MPGPPPTDPARRRRTNKSAGAAILHLPSSRSTKKPPALPAAESGWHPMTLAWWRDIWASPMAPEFDRSDLHGLYVLAGLVDGYWTASSPTARTEAAKEIRLQRQCFGLTPLDRRRLQWEIDRGDEAQQRTQKRRTAPKAQPTPRKDPRRLLA